jgi:hypothetical protein
MADILIIAALVLILGAAAVYIYKSKRKGRKCIGCPDSGCCSANCPGCSGKK